MCRTAHEQISGEGTRNRTLSDPAAVRQRYRCVSRLPRCLFTGYRTKIMCGGALMFALVGAAAQMRVRIDFYGECV